MTISNAQFTIEEAIAAAAELGTAEGNTSNMVHELALRISRFAMAGTITPGTTDIARLVEAYFDSKRAAKFSADGKDFSDGTIAKVKSQWNGLAKCGAHQCGAGVEVLEEALDLAAQMRAKDGKTYSKPLYQGLVDVAVAQNRVEHRLTTEEILNAMYPPKDKAEPTLAERVEAILKTTRNLVEGTKDKEGEWVKVPARFTDVVTSQRLEAAMAALELALAAAADTPNHHPAKV